MKRVKTFRLSDADLAVLDALSEELGGVSEAESLRALLAEGLKSRMRRCDPPIAEYFLMNLSPEGAAKEYLDYLDAVNDRLGLIGSDGKPPSHYFAQVPAGGKWEAKGLAGGWAVLPKSLRFTPDGYEQEV